MWIALLMLVPTGLVLGLMAFGRYGSRHVTPTFRSVLVVGVASILLGPIAVLVLGFVAWMLLVGLGVVALTLLALLRTPRAPIGH